MAELNNPSVLATPAEPPPDRLGIGRWFIGYGVCLAGLGAVLGWRLSGAVPQHWWNDAQWFAALRPAVKLAGFAMYLSVCTTFSPLPTGWIVAAVSARQAAVGLGLWDTVAMVALVGAAGSTIANINDYYLLSWILRSRQISKIRQTSAHQLAQRWFSGSPFFLLVLFNIIPIPIDVVRMLAASGRYSRRRFAAANFLGRFVRYAIIAFVTFYWNLGWIAAAVLLCMAAVIGASRITVSAARRLLERRRTCPLS